MTWMRKIVREVFGLFVDDGSFALAVLVWIGIVWAASHYGLRTVSGGVLLFLGLVLVLVESVTRFARRAADARRL